MRACLALVVALAALPLCPPPAGADQGAADQIAADQIAADQIAANDTLVRQAAIKAAGRQVQVLIDRALAALAAGGDDPGARALEFTDPANELAIATPELPLTIAYLPNLVAARAYRIRYDWANMEIFAGAVLRAFDGPDHAHQPMRIEAAARLAHAMIRQARGADAASILAPVIADLEGQPRSPEVDLARFWYGAALVLPAGPGWQDAAARAFDLRDSPMIGPTDLATFLDDYLFLLRETGGDAQTIQTVAEASARAATDPAIHPVDRAIYMGRVAAVLAEAGDLDTVIALVETELDQLGTEFGGHMARNALGMQLIRLWFQTNQIDRGIAFADQLLAETTALPSPNWVDQNLLQVLRGAAFHHLGRDSEAQEAWRRGYAAVRQYERASSQQARALAASIDPQDPGFAGFEYAGELSDASGLRPDGPADDVLLRFLAGDYALNERVFERSTTTAEDADPTQVARNTALHLALSGLGAQADDLIGNEISRLDQAPASAKDAQARDEFRLFSALSAFWWQGASPQDAAEAFADLPRLAASLPPDRASFVRALRAAALNNAGRMAETQAALIDWRNALDPARRDFTPWDVAAAMVAVEIAYALNDATLAQGMMALTTPWMDGQPPMRLARDYFALVRLMNAPRDLETDRGLLELGAIVQRLSAQVPQGHILRASSRFGLARALWARDRLPQARDMMAAAAQALRMNPDHRRDVMAFLQSSQAQILSQMGNHDLALNMARAAYDALTPQARPDYRVGIVITLAWELVANARQQEAATLAEAEFDDPAFIAGLLPELQIECLRTRASLQDITLNSGVAARLLDQADAIAAAHPTVSSLQRIALLWDRGVQLRNARQFEPALRSLAAANDAWFAERAKVAAASTSGQAATLTQDVERVLGELTVAWWLYQERAD